MSAPVNSILPAIAGTAEVGQTLTCSTGTWTNATSYAYQWLRDGVAITGATAATHAITLDDLLCALSCRVTATNSGDIPATTATADSMATIGVPSTLIVETGLIIAGADSYETLSNADIYHAKRGNTAWAAATAADKESAMRNGTSYLDGKYRPRLKGCKVRPIPTDSENEQQLEWPRYDVHLSGYTANGLSTRNYLDGWVFPLDQVPQKVKDATCEAALRALSGPLADDTDSSLIRKKIADLEWEWKPGAVVGQQTYQAIDQLLSDYLEPLGNCRAVRG